MKFLFIILALASGWYCQAQETILKGHIRNYNGGRNIYPVQGNGISRHSASRCFRTLCLVTKTY